MSTTELKSTLHQLIDNINDSKTLQAIITLLTQDKEGDWWNELSEKDKKAVELGLEQLDMGKGIPHSDVRKKVKNLLKAHE